MPIKGQRVSGAADMRHQRVKLALVIRVVAIAAKPATITGTGHPQNGDGWGTGRFALWARTNASTWARRSRTAPIVGTSTSIGLTRFPTAGPGRNPRPETGTVMAIGSTDSPQ